MAKRHLEGCSGDHQRITSTQNPGIPGKGQKRVVQGRLPQGERPLFLGKVARGVTPSLVTP